MTVDAYAKDLLTQIGRELDRSVFPVVKNGGFVLPSESIVFPKSLGKEPHHESKRHERSSFKSRSQTGGWQRPAGASDAAGRPWPSGETASLVGSNGGNAYQEELSLVCAAYPGARMWEQREGFWLYSESLLLPELGRKASFLTVVSTEKRVVRSWGFWNGGIIGASWIGPRHTNFPDGSVCAFEPQDGTWVFGDSLIDLLDFYSVWAVRHLHNEILGRWPGPQAVHLPYERLLEVADNELCGCGSSNKQYGDCCKQSDLRLRRVTEAIKFCMFYGWSIRQPPDSVLQFMKDQKLPPSIAAVIR